MPQTVCRYATQTGKRHCAEADLPPLPAIRPSSRSTEESTPLQCTTLTCHTCLQLSIGPGLSCLTQELKEVMQQQKLLQEAAAFAEAQARDAWQYQQDAAAENIALKQEIQVSLQEPPCNTQTTAV